jgi:hypothetical protein
MLTGCAYQCKVNMSRTSVTEVTVDVDWLCIPVQGQPKFQWRIVKKNIKHTKPNKWNSSAKPFASILNTKLSEITISNFYREYMLSEKFPYVNH